MKIKIQLYRQKVENFNEDLDTSDEIIITSIINEDIYISNKVEDISTPNLNGANKSIKVEYIIPSIIKKMHIHML